MHVDEIRYKPVGVIHSPFTEPAGTPIQAAGSGGVVGTVEIFREYAAGLKDLDGFSHIILLYHFHICGSPALVIKPYLDEREHGIFATRSPPRPNSVGISIVRLLRVENNVLHVRDMDIVDGTPLLDIKPYVPEFDVREVDRIGWLENRVGGLSVVRDDGRFAG